MSKSLGNVYLLKDIIERGYDPLTYKIFCYTGHYRNKLNFTWEGIEAASKSLERLRNSYRLNIEGKDELTIEDKEKIEKIEEKFHEAINDDMNMPLAMSYVWELARYEKKNPEISKMLKKFDTVLGIKIEKEDTKNQKEIPQEILDLVEQRKIARQNKDWDKSDELRNLINQKGYDIKDTANGTEVGQRGQS
ncbi:MAG: DALR domain-containing protein [Clostridia bacterium]|nr:DALR domain-containing protein [Clostridia bacterium]